MLELSTSRMLHIDGKAISCDYGARHSSNCMLKDDKRHALNVLVQNMIFKEPIRHTRLKTGT